MIIYLGARLPVRSSDVVESYGGQPCALCLAPSGVYMDPSGRPDSGWLLPNLFTLTSIEAVIFCCTFLEVTFTGS